MYTILKENPYKIAEDVRGIGFKTADEIAMKMGMAADSSERMESGMLYCLQLASTEGHTYLPKEELLQRSSGILEVSAEMLELPLSNLAFDRKVIIKTSEEETKVFLSFFYFAELTCAREMNLKTETGVIASGDQFIANEHVAADAAEILLLLVKHHHLMAAGNVKA